MSELDSRIAITVTIGDTSVTRVGFGIAAIVHKIQQSSLPRVSTYTSLTASRVDHPAYSPVGVFMTLLFGQGDVIAGAIPEKVKVINQGDAESLTTALDAALQVDSDFYGVLTPDKTPAVMQEGAAWALANTKFFGYSSPESDAITTATTDTFSVIQALSNNRAIGWYSAKAGGEFTIDTITVASTTATADLTGFGSVPVEVGDTFGIWTSAVSALNAIWTVDTVGASDFTFTVPAGTASDVAASDAWFDYNLIEAAAFGKMLPQDAGARTWDLQQLAGVTVDDVLTDTAQANLGAKNANWFSDIAGINVTSGLASSGGGGKMAGGRYADIQRGSDWLRVNLQLDYAELMIGSGGDLGFDVDGLQKVETKTNTRLDVGLDNKFLTPFTSGTFSGQNYNVSMPLLSDLDGTTDKANRLLSGIEIAANIRGKVHSVAADITLST